VVRIIPKKGMFVRQMASLYIVLVRFSHQTPVVQKKRVVTPFRPKSSDFGTG